MQADVDAWPTGRQERGRQRTPLASSYAPQARNNEVLRTPDDPRATYEYMLRAWSAPDAESGSRRLGTGSSPQAGPELTWEWFIADPDKPYAPLFDDVLAARRRSARPRKPTRGPRPIATDTREKARRRPCAHADDARSSAIQDGDAQRQAQPPALSSASRVPRGDRGRVADLVVADHPLDLGAREAARDQVVLGGLQRLRTGFESGGAPDVDGLVGEPVGEVQPAEVLQRSRPQPGLLGQLAARRAPPASASTPSSQAPCGNSQKRSPTGGGTARSATRASPSSGTISADGRLLDPAVEAGRAVGSSVRSSWTRIQRFS